MLLFKAWRFPFNLLENHEEDKMSTLKSNKEWEKYEIMECFGFGLLECCLKKHRALLLETYGIHKEMLSYMEQSLMELHEIAKLKEDTLNLLNNTPAPKEAFFDALANYSQESEGSKTYRLLKTHKSKPFTLQSLSNDKMSLKLLQESIIEFQKKVFILSDIGSLEDVQFLLALEGEWDYFYNQRADYEHADGSAWCDLWIEQRATKWQIILKMVTHYYVSDFFRKATLSEKHF
jgi:hypothetical protein